VGRAHPQEHLPKGELNMKGFIIIGCDGRFYVAGRRWSAEYPDALQFPPNRRVAAIKTARECKGAVVKDYGFGTVTIVADYRPTGDTK
jgi:hypothetical protein